MAKGKENIKHKGKGSMMGGSGGVWFGGFLGAAVYYVPLADGFWAVATAILKAIIWPAFLVHGLAQYINL